jgi:predicted secreted hydrolase
MAAVLAMLLVAMTPGAATRAGATRNGALVHLPADDAMHPAASTEWWYVVGHLRDARGRRYGYEAVVFRFAHLRAAVPSLNFDTVYRVDTAVTDASAGSFSGKSRYLAPAAGKTVMSTALLRIRAGGVSLDRLAGTGLRYRVQETAPDGTRLDVTMQTEKPPLLIGGTGVIPMGKRGSSYYYSLTHLHAAGTLVPRGKGRPLVVEGIAWMDHQWGTWDWSGIAGWDWMALQLDNGMELNVTDFQGGRGSPHKAATVSLPDGRQTVTLHVTMTPLGHWRSPATGITYPSGWRVRAPDVGLDLTVRPDVLDQELADRFAPDQSYWEGSCTVSGRLHGTTIAGQAYTELVGYGSAK